MSGSFPWKEELRALDPRKVTQDGFLRFTKLRMTDVAGAWQLGTPEQKYLVKLYRLKAVYFTQKKAAF